MCYICEVQCQLYAYICKFIAYRFETDSRVNRNGHRLFVYQLPKSVFEDVKNTNFVFLTSSKTLFVLDCTL